MMWAPNSHIVELKRNLRGMLTDDWQTVAMFTKKLRRADDSAVLYRLKEMVTAGEAVGSQFVNPKSGRVAWHYRKATTP